MLITFVILMMIIDVIMHGQGQITWRTTRFSFVNHFVFVLGLLFWRWRFSYFGLRLPGAQNTYRRIHRSYWSRPIHTRCYWAVFLERTESRTLESHESLVCLVCQVCQCLSWKTYTHWKKYNLKSETKLHILYAVYWTTLLPWNWRTKL